jgi:hypothetical protein
MLWLMMNFMMDISINPQTMDQAGLFHIRILKIGGQYQQVVQDNMYML